MAKEKPSIINISFKKQTLDDAMLLDWLQLKFEIYGKSNYIKQVLRKEMLNEINKLYPVNLLYIKKRKIGINEKTIPPIVNVPPFIL